MTSGSNTRFSTAALTEPPIRKAGRPVWAFLTQLLHLFPDAGPQEFAAACKRLALAGALTLRMKERGTRKIYRDYRGELDDEFFFHEPRRELRFQEAPMSRVHFRRLAALIEPPAGFKRARNPGHGHGHHDGGGADA